MRPELHDALKLAVAILLVVSWTGFMIIDYYWGVLLADAVRLREGEYGEMYGPLSWLRPVFLYTGIAVSILAVLALLVPPRDHP